MNKRLVIKIVIVAIALILFFVIFNKCSRNFVDSTNYETESMVMDTTKSLAYEYNLDDTPEKYGVRTSKKDRTEYFEYLKQYIKPVKLLNFIGEDDLSELFYNKSGHRMLQKVRFYAYRHMFEKMFESDVTDYNSFAVTDNFKNKFDVCMKDYFDIYGEEIYIRSLTEEENKLEVEAWWGILPDGDPSYGQLYIFKYTLDEEGNVDDMVLDYDTDSF